MENNKEKRITSNSGSMMLKLSLILMAMVTIFTMSGTGDWGGIVTNLGFLAIMAYMMNRAEKRGFRKMLHFAEMCQQTQGKLESNYRTAKGKALWEEMQTEEVSFGDEFVDSKWNKYISGELKEDAHTYLDEEEIMSHFEKSYCDMIPGLLTSLGILGTFLGLIFSMGSFGVENADDLQNILGSIVSGMNVAFYTSVYGVALSIMFNLINRRCQKIACESLYELCLDLNTYFKASATNDTTGRELLKQGESHVLELRGIKSVLRDELAETIGNTIGEQIEPVFKNINDSLEHVIGDFRNEQAASLHTVAEAFVAEMINALSSHIDGLGQSVNRLSLSQNNMTNEMRKLLSEIDKTAQDTNRINQVADDILQQFQVYLGQLNYMVETANATFQSVEEYAKEMSETSKTQHQVVCDLAKHENGVLKVTGNVETTYTSMKRVLDDNKDLVSGMGTQMQEFTASLGTQIENLGHSQKVLSEDLRRYAQGTQEVFTSMKEVQLGAMAQYQKCLQILEKLTEEASNKAVPKQEPVGGYSMDSGVVQLLTMQAESLEHITKYLEEQEKRREKSLAGRIQKRINKICGKFI